MTHGLNQEQLSHLKSLDSKKKKRKFLLDCMLENIDLEISNFFSKDYIKNESQEIIDKSNEPQPPMDFCVQITDENREVLQKVWREINGFKNNLFGNFLFSNSLFTYCYSQSEAVSPKSTVTTDEFLTYIGREDLIERKSVKISDLPVVENCEICHMYPKIENSNKCVSCYSCIKHIIENDAIFENYRPKKQVEEVKEKVDLSKELYLTHKEECKSVIRIIDYANRNGFGIGYHGNFISDIKDWIVFEDLSNWRKSTPEEIKSMLIKKLEADGLKVGCKVNREWAEPEKNEKIITINRIEYYYDSYYDTLECGGRTVYEKGKFATIIPQEEVKTETEQGDAVAKEEEAVKLTLNDGTVIWKTKWDILQEPKTENNELVDLSDEIKNIVVDFENVSQKENPQ